jgi:hypothetical protein
MTNYYLSTVQGSALNTNATIKVTEATSGPTADCIFEIGTLVPAANLSRDFVYQSLLAMANYVKTDDPRIGGAAVLPLTS